MVSSKGLAESMELTLEESIIVHKGVQKIEIRLVDLVKSTGKAFAQTGNQDLLERKIKQEVKPIAEEFAGFIMSHLPKLLKLKK